jgi:NTE family protein
MGKFLLTITYTFLMLVCLQSCCPRRYVPAPCPDMPMPFEVPERIRVALVLGSGGVRGMAHVGVLEELEEAGIPIDLIIGCSAGSIVGALYADNPNVEAIKCAVSRIRSQSMVDLDLWNCRYGLSQDHCMRRVLDKHLDAETFEDLQIPLIVVASDLHTGELVPIGSGNLVKAVQASCSIPFVFVPCEHMGRILVDGGVINPVPVKVARDLGAEIIIAVDLCEMLPQTFPTNLFQIATRSAEIAFMWQNEACTRGADVVIRPKTCGIGCFNDEMKAQIYQAGKYAASEKIAVIKELVGPILAEEHKFRKKRIFHPYCYTPKICLE